MLPTKGDGGATTLILPGFELVVQAAKLPASNPSAKIISTTGVAVGGTGVFVAVGGTGVFVGVNVGGTGVFVAVGGIGVSVGIAPPPSGPM